MSRFYEKAVANSNVNPAHIVPTSEHHYVELQHDHGSIKLNEHQAHSVNSMEQRIFIQPQTQVNPALLTTASSVVDFVIHPGMNLEIEDITLMLKINNASGGNIRFVPLFLIGESTFRNNGNDVYLRFDGRDLFLENAYCSYHESICEKNVNNIDPDTYRSAAVQATGTTKEYNVRLPSIFKGLMLGCLAKDTRVRISFVPANALETGTWTGCTVERCELILSGSERTSADFAHTQKIYKEMKTHHRYTDWVQYMQTRSISASTQQTYLLDSISGLVSNAFIYVENDGDAPYAIGTDDLISSISVVDQSGKAVTPTESTAYLRNTLAAKYFDGSLFSKVAVVPLVHARSPQLTKEAGIQSGYYSYSGNDKLVVDYNAAVVSGSHSLYFHARVYKVLTIQDGELHVGN